MKKVKLTTKLSLNKETIVNLNDEEMYRIQGGKTNTAPTCVGDTCYCPVTGNTCQLSCQNSCAC